jgi:hypothetical protein
MSYFAPIPVYTAFIRYRRSFIGFSGVMLFPLCSSRHSFVGSVMFTSICHRKWGGRHRRTWEKRGQTWEYPTGVERFGKIAIAEIKNKGCDSFGLRSGCTGNEACGHSSL